MDWTNIIIAGCGVLGAAIGSYSGFKLTAYRVEQLEKKVEKHNSVMERTFVLETKVEAMEQDIKEIKSKVK